MDPWIDDGGGSTGWVARQVNRICKLGKKNKTAYVSLLECYMRDDIPCGSPLCRRGCHGPSALPSQASHYLVPDTYALRHFWEILELPQLTAVIFLSSILKEVQSSLSVRHWKRLRSLFTDKRRSNFFFDDEHCVHIRDETGKGSTDGKVHTFAHWINEHLNFSVPIVILTGLIGDALRSDLPYLLQKSAKITVKIDKDPKILNVLEYVDHFWTQDQTVLDLCSSLVQSQLDGMQTDKAQQGNHEGNEGLNVFKMHLPAYVIEEGLQDGSLLEGIFHANKDSQRGGFVRPSNKGEATNMEVQIPAGKFQNRALHGDLVAVRVLSQHEELSLDPELIGVMLEQNSAGNLVDRALQDDEEIKDSVVDVKVEDESVTCAQKARFFGEVVGILQRLQKDYAACLNEVEELSSNEQSKRQEHVICVPMNYRLPMVRVRTRQRYRLVGQRFVIRIDDWDADSKLPRGHVVRILGPLGELETENRAILVENEINILPFCSGALQELPIDTDEEPWGIPSSEFDYRRDLRFTHRTYSIDPPGSKDVDDCLSIQHLDDNTMEIGVHIADVSYFVKSGGLLDLEALSRATTVYLVGDTYHMLPSVLSENLCSLVQGKDRLAVSVVWTVDAKNNLEILDVWFGRTIIRSRQQLFYAQAQCILDQKDLPYGWEISGSKNELVQIQSDLSLLAGFAQISKSLRESRGALELVSAEMRFEMGESQEPINVESKTQLPMNWIVAELMIQANSYVAQHIYQSLKLNALLRRHPPPKQDSFNYLLKCCEARGVRLNTSSNKALAGSLDDLQNTLDNTVQTAVKALTTRAMSEAEYVAAGDVMDPYGFSHYGLALEFYTHFTSPIRRYADIVVHRMLTSLCELGLEGQSQRSLHMLLSKRFTASKLNEAVYHLNERHRASKKAQKECNELHLLLYLQKHAQAEHAVVIELRPYMLLVYVPKYDLKGRVHLQDKTGNVILPAKHEEADDGIVSTQAGLHKYMLQYSENSIYIIDVDSKAVLHEYRRMCSIWIQMKADGSRAHSPTLRLRLLSQEYPAVRDLMLKEDTNLEQRRPQRPTLRFATSNIKELTSKPTKDRKPVKDMSLPQQTADSKLLKPKPDCREMTIHEILTQFDKKLSSASSVYVDLEHCEMMCIQNDICLHTQAEMTSKDSTKATISSTPMSMLRSTISVSPENPEIGKVRKAWQKKLVEASIQHRKHIRLIDANKSSRTIMQKLKVLKAQEEACLVYKSMQTS